MGLWIPLFLVLVTTSSTSKALLARGPKWNVDRTGNITFRNVTFPDRGCKAIKFDVKEKTVARITIEADDPGDCSTSDFHFHRNLDKWHIYDNEADACAQFDRSSAVQYLNINSRESGFTCTGNQTFFFPIESSCFDKGDPTITYTIETRPLDEEQAERCNTIEKEWKVDRSGTINTKGSLCKAVAFKVKEKSVARMSVMPNFYNSCDRFSVSKVLNISSPFDSEKDACRTAEFDSTLPERRSSESSIVESDFSCSGTQTVFYPIKFSCNGEVSRDNLFTYKIETRPLVGEEVDACSIVDTLGKASDTAEDIATSEGNDTAEDVATAEDIAAPEGNNSAEDRAAGVVALVLIPMLTIVGIVL